MAGSSASIAANEESDCIDYTSREMERKEEWERGRFVRGKGAWRRKEKEKVKIKFNPSEIR